MTMISTCSSVFSHTILLCSLLQTAVAGQATVDPDVMRGPCTVEGAPPYQRQNCSRAAINADINLGGLFPVHRFSSDSKTCTSVTSGAQFMQMPEAMRHAVDMVNRDPHLLKGIKLGYEIRDTCGSPSHALRECLEFIGKPTRDECTPEEAQSGARTHSNVVGVVGAAFSTLSIKTTGLLGLFKIPMVSYASTSPQLSNKVEFPFFLRTLPSDAFTGQAIAGMVRELDWNFIGFVHTADHYGEDGVRTVKRALGLPENSCSPISSKFYIVKERCQARTWSVEVNRNRNNPALGQIWKDILYSDPVNRTTVIVLFVQKNEAEFFLEYLNQDGHQEMYAHAISKNITFIGSDGWGDIADAVRYSLEISKGAVSPIARAKSYEDFREHWTALSPGGNPENPWLAQLWRDTFDCDLAGNASDLDTCFKNHSLSHAYSMLNKVPFVYDAVFAFAYALEDIYRQHCDYHKPCLKRMASKLVFKALKSVNFTTVSGNRFQFDSVGDPAITHYDVINLQTSRTPTGNLTFSFEAVGLYEAVVSKDAAQCGNAPSGGKAACLVESFHLNESAVTWNSGGHTRPVSDCSKPCPVAGHRRECDGTLDCQTCCWVCLPCAANHVSESANASTCRTCATHQYSSPASATCADVPVKVFSAAAWLPAILVGFAVLGVAGSAAAVVHSLRKAGDSFFVFGKEPTIFALCGLLIAYVSVIAQSGGPTGAACSARVVLSGIGLTAVNSSLLIFTVYRVTSVQKMAISTVFVLSRNRFLGSLAAECLTCALFIIYCSGGRCSTVLETVFDHERAERRCGFRLVDTACLAYLCVINTMLMALCVLMMWLVRRRGISNQAYDLRARLFPLMSVAAGLSTLLTIVFLISKSATWSPQVEDSMLHVVTLQFATVFFLAVFLQPVRKLGLVEEMSMDESKEQYDMTTTSQQPTSAMQLSGMATLGHDACPNNLAPGSVMYFGSDCGPDKDAIDKDGQEPKHCGTGLHGSGDSTLRSARQDRKAAVTSSPGSEKSRTFGSPSGDDIITASHPGHVPPSPGDHIGRTVLRVVRMTSIESSHSSDIPAIVVSGLPCQEEGTDQEGDQCWMQVVPETMM